MQAKKETKEETKEEAVERAIRYRNLAALEKLLAENPALVNSADKVRGPLSQPISRALAGVGQSAVSARSVVVRRRLHRCS